MDIWYISVPHVGRGRPRAPLGRGIGHNFVLSSLPARPYSDFQTVGGVLTVEIEGSNRSRLDSLQVHEP